MTSGEWFPRLIAGGVLLGVGAVLSAVVLGSTWALLTGALAGNAVVCGWCAFGIWKLRQRFKMMGAGFGKPPTS